jgi:hypothetical protein
LAQDISAQIAVALAGFVRLNAVCQ